jgi:hypothetical protein
MDAAFGSEREHLAQFGAQDPRIQLGRMRRDIPMHFTVDAIKAARLIRAQVNANRKPSGTLGDYGVNEAVVEKPTRAAECLSTGPRDRTGNQACCARPSFDLLALGRDNIFHTATLQLAN